MIDWRLWIPLGGLLLVLLGQVLDMALCHGMQGNARAVCGIVASTAEDLGRDAEQSGPLVPDAGL